ncbi:MAG: TolC family protein [Rhodocyclaceae bacterium]|nr:TolC family protein [Rhodocyclaceae bacterium]
MKRLLLACLLVVGVVQAAEPDDLPPADEVGQALRAYPLVQSAAAGLAIAVAQRDRLVAGANETTLRLSGLHRQDVLADQRMRDYELGLERAFRLPAKAALDAEIGALGIEQARHAYREALRESRRQLLMRWFAWLRAAAACEDWQKQVSILRAQHAAAAKKVDAGESARLEVLLAEAQLAQAEAQLEQAKAQRERTAIELREHFPALTLPERPRLSTPVAPAIDAAGRAQWRARILAADAELAAARSAARRSRLEAGRIEAERRPDPTVGLTLARERDGQERVIGVHLAIPFPGEARLASARAASAEAEAAAAREAFALRRAAASAEQTLAAAINHYAQWQRLESVALRLEENVRLLERAWRLGEGAFADLQTARRQAIEARLAATQAQLDANEARYRLWLEAGELWSFPDALADSP